MIVSKSSRRPTRSTLKTVGIAQIATKKERLRKIFHLYKIIFEIFIIEKRIFQSFNFLRFHLNEPKFYTLYFKNMNSSILKFS
jgi:hypothetical protein